MYVSDGAHYFGILVVDCCEYKVLVFSTSTFSLLIVVNKLLSFHHEHVSERMARLTMAPTLHQFFSRKGEEHKDAADDVQMVQVQLHNRSSMFI